MVSLHADPPRAHGGRAATARCSCWPRSASSSRRRTSSRRRPIAGSSRRRPTSSSSPCCSSTARCRSAPTPCFADFDTGIFYVLAVSSISAHRRAHRRLVVGQQVLPHGRPPRRRPAHRLRAADGAGGHRRGDPGRHHEPPGHRHRPGRRRDLRLGRARQPVLHHPVRGHGHLPHRGPGRADPDPVRHADRRVRARHRLHDRVLGHALPAVLHRRVRRGRLVRRGGGDAVPGGWALPGPRHRRPTT